MFYLPAQSRDKVFISLAASCVGENGVLVLLALSHIKYCDFMSLTAKNVEETNQHRIKMNTTHTKTAFPLCGTVQLIVEKTLFWISNPVLANISNEWRVSQMVIDSAVWLCKMCDIIQRNTVQPSNKFTDKEE